MKRGYLTLILLLFLSATALKANSSVPFGKKVSMIHWHSPLPYKKFSRLIVVKKGEILSQAALQRTIKLIYATGKVRQITATAEFDDTGNVEVTFHATPNYFISSIHISGNKHLSDKKIRAGSDLHKRVMWNDDNANDIREKIVLLYQREGYPNPGVTLETVVISSWKVRINITVDEGNREKIEHLNYSDNCYPLLSRRIRNQLSLSYKSNPLTNTTLTNISKTVANILAEYKYHTPTIGVEKEGDKAVKISIDHGPLYRLSIEGNKAFSLRTLTSYIVSFNRKTIQQAKTKEKLTEIYQAYGFPYVKIHFAIEEHIDNLLGIVREVHCSIDEGERLFITKYHFNGAKKLDAKMLQQRISNFMHDAINEQNFPQLYSEDSTIYGTKKAHFHDAVQEPTAGMTIPDNLLPFIKTFLLSVYREQGYLDTKINQISLVKKAKKIEFSADIQEGEQTIIASVIVKTKKEIVGEKLKKELHLNSNIPYNKERGEEYKQRIEEELEKRGYLYATLSVSVERRENHVYLTYELDNLTPVHAGIVVFNGNYKTSDWLLLRMVRFKAGKLITEKHLKQSIRNLHNTGFFTFVRIDFIDDNLPGDYKDIVVTVQESNTGHITQGIGVSTDEGGFVYAKFQFTNIGGSGLTLKSSLKMGRKIDYFMPDAFRTLFQSGFSEWEKIDRNITVTLLMPDMLLLPTQITMQVDAFHIHLIKSNAGYPYLKDKNGMMVLFYRRFLEHYFLSVGNELFYQNEKEYNQNNQTIYIDRLLVKPQFKAEIDFRNNLFFPSQGMKVWVAVENQTALAGTSSSFTKLENSIAGYLPLIYKKNYTGKYIPQDTLIFHSFFNFSIIFLHDGSLSSDDALKLGGSSSMRGYYSEMMFPQDNQSKDARGTLVYYLRNELRLKLYDNFYLSAFLDMGNIWENLDNLGDNEAFRFAAGSGIAYVSPIGSLKLQLGFNLNPRSYEDTFAIHAYISSQ
ncbi:BamA/TamA family outer membrane protein [bacterium]|nr:BamA/TamA family outer membrane protein [bacterium]